jgi:hypothetical protein
MRWLLFPLVLGVLVGVMALVGSRLPKNHIASRSAIFSAERAALWATITAFQDAASWRSDLSRVEMLPIEDGKIRWIELSKQGRLVLELVEKEEPKHLITRLADDKAPFTGSWTIELQPEGAHTRVSITERGEVKNPIFRFMSKYVFGHTGTLDEYLKSLGAKHGEQVTPS